MQRESVVGVLAKAPSEAALPESDDHLPLRLPKRRRVSVDDAARFYAATNHFSRSR